MSENTVSASMCAAWRRKVSSAPSRRWWWSKDGRPLNGNLSYTIRPIQTGNRIVLRAAVPATGGRIPPVRERWNALAELAHESPQNALCAPFGEEGSPSTDPGLEAQFGPLWRCFRGRKKSRINDGSQSAPVRAPLPAVRAVAGLCGIGNGVKIRAVTSSLRS